VEGEGNLKVRVRDGQIEIAEFGIFEPPRFYEAFLRAVALATRPTSPPASAAFAPSPTR